MSRWFEEILHRDFRLGLNSEKILYEGQTSFQRIVLFENQTLGRVLTLDGVIQTTEADEFIYHEMLAHVPVLAHGDVRKVLILGGGDGGMLEEVLKHADIEQVTMVEIDAAVIELSKTYLGKICGRAFEDPRTEVVIGDGVEFVAACTGKYDVIIVDSPDPIGPGEALFTERFYQGCKACLAPGGVLATQNGVPFLQSAELRGTLRHLHALFADAACFLATVPTYAGGPMAFGWGTDDPRLRRHSLAALSARYEQAEVETRYYTPAVHRGAFDLPGYISALIQS